MNKNIVGKFLGVILGLGVALSSCQKDLEPASFVNLEDEYELSISQQLTTNGGLASLTVKTITEQECSNSNISYQLDSNQENIKVSLNQITSESACIGPPAIISEQIDFDFYHTQKEITVALQNAISNSGILIAEDDEIRLALNSNHGIKISKAKINRINRGMIWGTLQSSTDSTASLVIDYLTEINNQKTVKTGDYGHFYVNSVGQLQTYDTPTSSIHDYVIYTNIGYAQLVEKIQEYKEIDPSLIFQDDVI